MIFDDDVFEVWLCDECVFELGVDDVWVMYVCVECEWSVMGLLGDEMY